VSGDTIAMLILDNRHKGIQGNLGEGEGGFERNISEVIRYPTVEIRSRKRKNVSTAKGKKTCRVT